MTAKRRRRLTLREAREHRKLTQTELADRTRGIDPRGLGVNQRTISDLETGDVPDPMYSTAILLERALRLQRGSLVFPASGVCA